MIPEPRQKRRFTGIAVGVLRGSRVVPSNYLRPLRNVFRDGTAARRASCGQIAHLHPSPPCPIIIRPMIMPLRRTGDWR